MSATSWPDHLLGLTEWAELPEDTGHHYELVEGVLQVSPRPGLAHQLASGRLYRQLADQLPAELVVVQDVEVVLSTRWPASVRAPDLVVVPDTVAKAEPARCEPGSVSLAVEVISPGSRERDEVTKLYEYSEAGIPDYWILDLDGRVTLTAYHLVDGEYAIVGRGSGSIPLTEPAAVTVDVGGLLPHRA